MGNEVIYPPCKKCGASHQMGVEEMATGKITPMDMCENCLWYGVLLPMNEQVSLIIDNVDEKEYLYEES